ncbi:MAG: hypothetical protein Ct9H300mP1_23060 [Planctomycetaceae bacterium]|nr:MAG: hypothetical protein Ct9H300mP1_23060 [Planctomycetaceae bacterium]
MYATDASVFQIMPAAVPGPRNAEDVAVALAFCREHGLSITARGGGTSQAGQAIGAGLQLDFSKHLNEILEIQPDLQRVRVQPGIVLDKLNAVLKPYNLTLPLDLSTSSRATIGGMISNNSSGTRSVIYGKTIDYVESLAVMMSDGSTVNWTMLPQPHPAASRWHHSAKNRQTTRPGTRDEISLRYPGSSGGWRLQPRRIHPTQIVPPTSRRSLSVRGDPGTGAEATLRLVPLPSERPC